MSQGSGKIRVVAGSVVRPVQPVERCLHEPYRRVLDDYRVYGIGANPLPQQRQLAPDDRAWYLDAAAQHLNQHRPRARVQLRLQLIDGANVGAPLPVVTGRAHDEDATALFGVGRRSEHSLSVGEKRKSA